MHYNQLTGRFIFDTSEAAQYDDLEPDARFPDVHDYYRQEHETLITKQSQLSYVDRARALGHPCLLDPKAYRRLEHRVMMLRRVVESLGSGLDAAEETCIQAMEQYYDPRPFNFDQ